MPQNSDVFKAYKIFLHACLDLVQMGFVDHVIHTIHLKGPSLSHAQWMMRMASFEKVGTT